MGAEVSCFSLHLSVFNTDAYRMFYASSTASLFGPEFASRVHSHVVFSREDTWSWCDKHLVPLDRRRNQVMRFSPSGNSAEIPTQIRSATNADDVRPHTVAVVVFGDLHLPQQQPPAYEWSPGRRLKFYAPDASSKNPLPRVVCPYCGDSMSTLTNLKHHYFRHHSDFVYKCRESACTFSTKNEKALEAHVKGHDGIKSLKCDVEGCKFSTNYGRHLYRHKIVKHSGQKYSCEKCDRPFTTPEGLEGHIRAHHEGKSFSCHHVGCGYTSGYRARINEHYAVEHNGRRLECALCSFSCGYERQFNAHRSATSKSGPEAYKHTKALMTPLAA